MKGISMPYKAIAAMCCIAICYTVYMCTHPSNGVLFGTVMLAIGALGGVTATEVIRSRT
jgi:hypothetical protein